MNTIIPSIPTSVYEALSMVFLHSLWQFTLLAAILSLALKRNWLVDSASRYRVSLATMAFMLASAITTFYICFQPQDDIASYNIQYIIHDGLYTSNTMAGNTSLSWIERMQPWILMTWTTGILLLSMRWTGSMIYLSWLKKRAVFPTSDHTLVHHWNKILATHRVQKNIRLGLSHAVNTPMIMGQIKPVLLLPFSLVNQLTPEEAECILLHELAHYTRFDWWVNMIQSWVEILFYYHPAVYFVSAVIRRERENCCDDYAIKTMGGNNIPYAKTLIKLQEWEANPSPSLALAFSNNPKIFIDRIQKILNMNQRKNVKNENMLIGMIMVCSLFFVTRETIAKNFDYSSASSYLSDFFHFTKPSLTSAAQDTMPKVEENITIVKKSDEKEVKIEMKNGEIQHMEINGEEIKPEDYDKHKDITGEIRMKTIRRGDRPEDSFYFFDIDGDNMKWNGNFEFNMDSLMGDIDWENMKDHKIHMEKMQEKMHGKMQKMQEKMQKMQEKMQDHQIRIFGVDSMLTLEMPERRMEWIITPDDLRDLDEEERIFEFHTPGQPRIEKRIEIERGDRVPRIEKRIEIEHGDGFMRSRSTSDVLGAQLNKDGLLLPQKENKIELTGKYLKINGEKQPTNIWNKYKRIFEEESGTTLEKNSRITFHFLGRETKRMYKSY